MKRKNIIAAIAAMSSLMIGGQLAHAEFTQSNIGTIVAEAKTQTATTASGVTNYTFRSGGIPLAGHRVRITLSAGVFATSPLATPTQSADFGGGTLTATLPSAGGAGKNFAEWSVVTAPVAGDLIKINLNTATVDMTGVAAGKGVDLTLTLLNGVGTVSGTAVLSDVVASNTVKGGLGHNLIDKKSAVNIAAGTTLASDTVTVSSKYLKWSASGTTTSASSALTIKKDGVANGANTTVSIVTLTGDFTGVKSVTVASGATATGSDAAGATTGGISGEFLIAANKKSASIAVTNDGATENGGAGIDIAPTFVLDGTTAQTTARVFTVDASLKADATYNTSVALTTSDFFSMKRDGTVFSLNSFGPANTLKITDRSNAVLANGAAISVMAYDAAGAVVPVAAGATALPVLPANGTVSILGSKLVADYAAAVRFDVTVDSNDVVASNVKKTATGVTVSSVNSTGKNGSL